MNRIFISIVQTHFYLLLFLLLFSLVDCKSKADEIYICPMHPEYTSADPGDCPICGMKLVPKKKTPTSESKNDHANHSHANPNQDNHNHEDQEQDQLHKHDKHKNLNENHDDHKLESSAKKSITVSIEQQKSIGVKTAPVQSREMESNIVSSGQVVYDMDIYTAMVEYVEAIKLGSSMDSSFRQSARRKLLRLGIGDSDIQVWSRKNPEIFLSGRSGNMAYVFTQIFERDLRHLKKGQVVKISASSYPGKIFTGRIIGWYQLLDEKNRSTQAWIEVQDSEKLLQPRMFTETKIHIPIGKVLVVPRNAVMHTGKQVIVYVKIGEDTFRPTKVTIGNETDDSIQILSGLEVNDEVVVGANFLLDSEARMQLGRDL
ncbi:MAG: efflux RND transporter periplasmic adaptor subunit [Leptospira sp.]|nr:efflux RND transporter periplasmic adaptor subunit [Leptospira sp.]